MRTGREELSQGGPEVGEKQGASEGDRKTVSSEAGSKPREREFLEAVGRDFERSAVFRATESKSEEG